MQTNLVIYNDVQDFGGHEVMVLQFLKYILQKKSCNIYFICSAKNKKLINNLNNISKELGRNINIIVFQYSSGKLQLLRTFLAVFSILKVKKIINEIAPSCVLVVQGEISLSSVGIIAAKLSGIKAISYIPMAHARVQRGDKYFAILKDRVLGVYYSLPNAFITISNSVGQDLIKRGSTQPIKIVYNGIDIDRYKFVEKATARKKLGFRENEYIVGLIGRIEFDQKQQDSFMKVIAKRKSELQNTRFLIVGNGPDEAALLSIIKSNGMMDYVKVIPWQEDLADVYSAINMIAIPSKFEGLPIVMLEAMLYKLPVIASNVDGMAEILPKDWLFDCQNEKEIWNTLLSVSRSDNGYHIDNHHELVKKYFSIKYFNETFYAELNSLC